MWAAMWQQVEGGQVGLGCACVCVGGAWFVVAVILILLTVTQPREADRVNPKHLYP